MKKIVFSLILLLVCLFLYGRYIEVNNFKVKEYDILASNAPSSFQDLKIIQFSDVLYVPKESDKKLNQVIEDINKEDGDIVIFSGDLLKSIVNYKEEDYNYLKEEFKLIKANLYKIAVIGDNDNSNLQEYKDILYESGFNLLDNQNMLLFYKNEEPINIIGITNYNDIADFNTLLTTDVPYNYSLVISHTPDVFKNLDNYNINTILSGHSLGGILNIPFYGGLIKKEGAKTYLNNYYKIGNKELFISNGIGYEDFNFRLFNTPSINVYRFTN